MLRPEALETWILSMTNVEIKLGSREENLLKKKKTHLYDLCVRQLHQ
jgi:hypothetical protein